MPLVCHISNETVDERAARISALLVLIPLGLSLPLRSPWPALFLAMDFGLRGFGARRWSPVSRLSGLLAAVLGHAPKPTNAGPKAFAAKLGFGFSVTVTLAFLLGHAPLGWVAGVPFALCALLEGTLGYCVGCRIYQAWQRLRPLPVATDASAPR
jgi:hypothetical protein